MAAPDWLAAVEPDAPDVVAVWRLIDTDFRSARRELRQRAGPGSAERVLAQQEAVADALAAALGGISEEMLRAPGGEEEWNVAQTFAHTTGARRWLARAGAWAARDVWPTEVPAVVPGVPGAPDAKREALLTLLAKSRRSMAESAAAIAGHESDPCPLEHPLVGRLRCGEWLLFAGVHDLMHVQQLHRLREGGGDAAS